MSPKKQDKPIPADYGEALAAHRYTGVFNSRGTFLGVGRAEWDRPESFAGADVVIVGAPFDGGASYRPGSRFAPGAIRSADYLPLVPYRPHLELGLEPFSRLTVVDAGDVPMPPSDIQSSFDMLEKCTASIAAAGAVPIVLGGDHSIAYPNMCGMAQQRGKGSFGVVHFDAHADTGDTSDFGLSYGHGTPMRRAIESGAVRGDRFVQLGLRGYWPAGQTLQWAREQGVRWYDIGEISRRGLAECLEEAAGRMQGLSGVYLSFDIDVVDPGMAPGTGTPEPGGLTSRQALDAVRICAMKLPLVGMELVEVSPPYDSPGAITAFLANRIVLEALSGIAWRRQRSAHE